MRCEYKGTTGAFVGEFVKADSGGVAMALDDQPHIQTKTAVR